MAIGLKNSFILLTDYMIKMKLIFLERWDMPYLNNNKNQLLQTWALKSISLYIHVVGCKHFLI